MGVKIDDGIAFHRNDTTTGSITRPMHGNARAYTIARLMEQRPDLYERVKAGDLSANAAAIEAGWRERTITVPYAVPKAARALRRLYSADELMELIARLKEGA